MNGETDDRPALWVGHVTLTVADPPTAHDFYVALGMRTVFRGPSVSITELRGGTHMVLLPGDPTPGPAPFDLMVDDVDGWHARLRGDGVAVGEILRGDIHDTFSVTDPDGYVVTVSNSHVVGAV
jgi:catechol 2,3-dioxygenase-like lactoylglutathione lyase family enzyme